MISYTMHQTDQYPDQRTSRLENVMREAAAHADARGYAQACIALGIEPSDSLYEEGMGIIEAEQDSRRGLSNGLEREAENPQIPNFTNEDPTWGRLTKIALRRFPELLPGESIHIKEIKRRLGQMREAGKAVGYDVNHYGKMDKDAAWAYLARLRADIAHQAKTHCPQALQEVTQDNQQQKEDVYLNK